MKGTETPGAAAVAGGFPWSEIAAAALCAWKGDGWEAAATASESLAGAEALAGRYDGPRTVVAFRLEGALTGAGALVVPGPEARSALGLADSDAFLPAAQAFAGALAASLPAGTTLTALPGEESDAADPAEVTALVGAAMPAGQMQAVTAKVSGPAGEAFTAEVLLEMRIVEIGRALRDLEHLGLGKDRAHEETPAERNTGAGRLGILMDVELPLIVRLGEVEMTLEEILKFRPGSVIELDKMVDDPAELIVNNKVVAFGEVVVVNENFGLRITRLAEASGDFRA